jgi:cytochrome c-type biogenesis protein CcmH
MEIYLFFGVGVLLAIAFFLVLGIPVLRPKSVTVVDDRGAALVQRLADIERDRASRLIGDDEAAEAIVEAKRAALAPTAGGGSAPSRPWRFAAVAFLALAPIAAAPIYVAVGAPTLIDPPAKSAGPALDPDAIAAMSDTDRQAMIEGMVASLSARLEQSPDDAEGWRMLARSQLVLQRPADSAASYRRLLALEEGAAEDWRNFATALAASLPSGRFPKDEEFLGALDKIEAFDPGDPMVLFYRGGAAKENGEPAQAAAIWSQLLEGMPDDAPVRGTLQSLIDEAQTEIE